MLQAEFLDAVKFVQVLVAALISTSNVFKVPTIISSLSSLLLMNRGGVSLCEI